MDKAKKVTNYPKGAKKMVELTVENEMTQMNMVQIEERTDGQAQL